MAPDGWPVDAESIRLMCDLPNLIRVELVHQRDLSKVDLAPLRSLPQLEILALKCTAKDLQHFSNQRKLRELYLGEEGITDDCAKLLQNNPRLTSLSLLGTSTSDALAPHLARLEQLEFLQMIDTKISSAGILQLSQLKNLQQLLLVGEEVDDAAIPAIVQLKSLRYLSVHNTRISDDGIEELRRALPNCKLQ